MTDGPVQMTVDALQLACGIGLPLPEWFHVCTTDKDRGGFNHREWRQALERLAVLIRLLGYTVEIYLYGATGIGLECRRKNDILTVQE